MARFRLRFRKTLPIIPGIFFITINKQSWSWNLRLGPYSKTWGKNHTIQTVDAPGTFGASWRKTQRRSKKSKQAVEKEPSSLLLLSLILYAVFAAAVLIAFNVNVIFLIIAITVGLVSKWFFGLEKHIVGPFIAMGSLLALIWIF